MEQPQMLELSTLFPFHFNLTSRQISSSRKLHHLLPFLMHSLVPPSQPLPIDWWSAPQVMTRAAKVCRAVPRSVSMSSTPPAIRGS